MSEQEHGIGANPPPDPVIVAKNSRIAELEAENARLRAVIEAAKEMAYRFDMLIDYSDVSCAANEEDIKALNKFQQLMENPVPTMKYGYDARDASNISNIRE